MALDSRSMSCIMHAWFHSQRRSQRPRRSQRFRLRGHAEEKRPHKAKEEEGHLTNLATNVGKALSRHFGERGEERGSFAKVSSSKTNSRLGLAWEIKWLLVSAIWCVSASGFARAEEVGAKWRRLETRRRRRAAALRRPSPSLLPLFSVRVLSLLTVFPAIYCYSNGIRGASPAKSPLLTLR